MKLIPKDYVAPEATGPLKITKAGLAKMVTAAVAMVTEPIESGDLANRLEQHYVAQGKHYTSAQLKEVVDGVAKELYVAPPVEEGALEFAENQAEVAK